MRCLPGLVLSLFLTTLAAFSQAPGQFPKAPKFTSVPPIEDRELYYSFFNYHQALIASMQSAKAKAPQHSNDLDQQMARLLRVDVKELAIVNNNTQQVKQKYASLAAEQQAYAPKSGEASPKSMAPQFELKRIRITIDGVSYLSQNLSPASWAGLHGYIIGTYRNSIQKH